MNQPNQNTNIDIQEYWHIFLRRKWFFIIPFIICAIGGIGYSFIPKPVYESHTVVRVNQGQMLSRNMQRMMPGVTSQERLNNLRRLITSQSYLKRLISTLELHNDPNIIEVAQKKKAENPDLELNSIVELILIKRLKNFLEIRQQGSDFIQITAFGGTPQMAYNYASVLTQIFIDESLRNEVGGIRGALEFSNEQLNLYKQKLDESEEKLRKFRQGILEEEFNQRVDINANMDQVNNALTVNNLELRESNDRLSYLNIELRDYNVNYIKPAGNALNSLKASLLESMLEFSRLMLENSWQDPNVLRMNSQMEELRDRIRRAIEIDIKSQAGNGNGNSGIDLIVQKEIILMDVDFLKRKKEMLTKTINFYKESLAKGPTQELTLNRLQSDVNTNREIYQMFLEQMRGSEIEEALQRSSAESKFEIVEPAIMPIQPVSPNRMKLALMGIALGIAMGVGFIFLLEYMDKSFKKIEDVEKYLGIPVLGTIPKIESDDIKI